MPIVDCRLMIALGLSIVDCRLLIEKTFLQSTIINHQSRGNQQSTIINFKEIPLTLWTDADLKLVCSFTSFRTSLRAGS